MQTEKKRFGFKPKQWQSQWSRCSQNTPAEKPIIQNKQTTLNKFEQNTKMDDTYIYIDSNEFKLKNIIFTEKKRKVGNTTFINFGIRYRYGNLGETNSHPGTDVVVGTIEAPLKIRFKDIRLSQSRFGAYPEKFSSENKSIQKYFCPYDRECIIHEKIQEILVGIRKEFMEYIKTSTEYKLDEEKINSSIEKKSMISMTNRKGEICRVIKLGSKSENNINREIHSIAEFNSLLRDGRYNKRNSDSFYKTNQIIGFSACLYECNPCNPKPEKYATSVKPYVKSMEMMYSKASCISIINTQEKICPKESILIL